MGLRKVSDPDHVRGYRQRVILAAAISGVLVFIVAGLAWTARLVHVGNLDAHALAEKAASAPRPLSALDWPELHLRGVVAQPDEPPLVLLHVDWPRHPRQEATLLVALDRGDDRSLSLLSQWCAGAASLSPSRRHGEDGGLELRRRQSLERVRAVLITEDGPE
jgi:hypothetical protein